MKKLMASIMAIGMMCAASVPAFAASPLTPSNQESDSTISLEVVASDYSITIPDTITASLNGSEYVGTADAPVLGTGAMIGVGQTLKVSISKVNDVAIGDTGKMNLTASGVSVEGVLYIEGETDTFTDALKSTNNALLTVAAADVPAGATGKKIQWKTNKSNVTAAGTYTGKVTYAVAVVSGS